MRKKSRRIYASPNKLLLFLCSLFLSISVFSQTVSGVITDGSKPVGKVTVQVKGTTRATTTNDGGRFAINASGNDTLLISSVGFLQQEQPVEGRQTVKL